jgi:ABC-type branched-subunit amino acid transport system ATPase component/MFS family permease
VTTDDSLGQVRAGEAAIAALEQDARALHEESLAALGFSPAGETPPLRAAIVTSGAGWANLVGIALLALPSTWLTLTFLMFDLAIAKALGIEMLGFRYPGFLNSLYIPLLAVTVAAGGFGTAWVVFRRRWRARVLVLSAAATALALWLAAFATTEWGLVVVSAISGAALGARYAAGMSLLVDSYPPEVRVRAITWSVFCTAAGSVVGGVIVVVGADVLSWTWRGVLVAMAALASVVGFASLFVRDPGVGTFDIDRIDDLVRERVGVRGTHAAELTEQAVAVGFGEQLRHLFATRTATAMVVVFLIVGTLVVPLHAFIAEFVAARYGWGFSDWASLYTAVTAAGILPLPFLLVRGDARFRADPSRLMRVCTRFGVVGAVALAVVAFVANAAVTVVGLVLAYSGVYVILAVALIVLLSVIDPQLRPHGAALAATVLAAAVLAGGVVPGQLADRYGITAALTFYAVSFLAVAGAMRLAARSMEDDLGQLVDAETEREELRVRVSSGQHFPLLGCRRIAFSYGQVQVLFGVNFTVDDGEMVALLGTNGAGKSTLLHVISGLGKPSRGSVHFRGADITYLEPTRRVKFGITQIPGGRSVFDNMTVAESLKIAGFSVRRSRRVLDAGIDATFDAFPALASRRNQAAATLSGGEQQMLSLGKALILKPRLLLIDELSLGLAPLVVGQLIEMVQRINDAGTAVVLVEQSVNIALGLVDHAYFMERGEIRFDGAASDLVDRPDLLRSVFLEGASQGLRGGATGAAERNATGGDS